MIMVVHIFYQCTEVRFASFLSGGFTTSDAGIGGAKGATGPPIFGRSVNPIPTGEGRLSPPITTGTPNVFHLQASLLTTMAVINPPERKLAKRTSVQCIGKLRIHIERKFLI